MFLEVVKMQAFTVIIKNEDVIVYFKRDWLLDF